MASNADVEGKAVEDLKDVGRSMLPSPRSLAKRQPYGLVTIRLPVVSVTVPLTRQS